MLSNLLSIATIALPLSTPVPAAPSAEASDEDLMAQVAKGGHDAFAILVGRHERWARTFAGRALGDFIEAEDVVQDAFLKVWQTAPSWRPSAPFRHWFSVILSRRCIDYQRRKRPEPVAEIPERPDHSPGVVDRIEDAERIALAGQLVAQLPDRARMAILLVYGEGRKTAEAAEAMDMHLKAFESLLLRARRDLHRMWQEKEAGHA